MGLFHVMDMVEGPGVVVSDGYWYLLGELDCSLVTIMMWSATPLF